jgi:hypothetical protein
MSVQRCTCCDLPLESCGIEVERRQRQAAQVERARLLAIPGAFPARYDGPCVCGEWFKAGDPIVRGPDAGSWRCLMCCEA